MILQASIRMLFKENFDRTFLYSSSFRATPYPVAETATDHADSRLSMIPLAVQGCSLFDQCCQNEAIF